MSVSKRLATDLGALESLDTEAFWAQEPALKSLTSGQAGTEFAASSGCTGDQCECSGGPSCEWCAGAS